MTGLAGLTELSAVRLAELIRAGAVSPVQVLDAYLRRVGEVNPRINAVVRLAPGAEQEARAAEAAVLRGESLGPLHGVPFTVKDNIETAGVVTAIGVPQRAGLVPQRDATVVSRMRAAGAILLGKTNCPPWGGGDETDNELYGRTSNPHDPTRTPGGSSGGEAAIVAARGSPCGWGTDSGGSVRVPAHFCGVAALKPTAGRVPVTGVLDDEGQIGALSDPRSQVGPIARRVEDVALLLRLVAGPDGRDAGVSPVPLGDPARLDVAGLRVGCYADNHRVTPTEETVAAVRAAAATLAAAGALVREVDLPGDGHGLTVEVWRSYDGGLSSQQLYRLLRRWDAYRTAMAAFMDDIDVLLCPVFPVPAPLHGGMADPALRGALSYTTPYSLTGAPCAALPYATSPAGLPIAVQVVARPWRDDVVLRVAQFLEAASTAPAAPAAIGTAIGT
jgi:amidase